MAENWRNSEHIHLLSRGGSLKSNSADLTYREKKWTFIPALYQKLCRSDTEGTQSDDLCINQQESDIESYFKRNHRD